MEKAKYAHLLPPQRLLPSLSQALPTRSVVGLNEEADDPTLSSQAYASCLRLEAHRLGYELLAGMGVSGGVLKGSPFEFRSQGESQASNRIVGGMGVAESA